METPKCPSCGDVMHQHRTPSEVLRDEQGREQPTKTEQPPRHGYRCGQCGRLYRYPPALDQA